MMRSVHSETWCKMCFFCLLLGAGILSLYLTLEWVTPPMTAQVRGWCCAQQGQACTGNTDPVACGDQGGFAFSRDELVCTVACASSSPPHAASTSTQP